MNTSVFYEIPDLLHCWKHNFSACNAQHVEEIVILRKVNFAFPKFYIIKSVILILH